MVLLLGYLLTRIPLAQMWQQIVQLSPGTLLLSFLIFLFSNALFAAAWAVALRAMGFSLSFQTVAKVFYQSLFINNFATFIGGDSLRVYEVGRTTQRMLDATLSVLISRIAMLYSILLLTALLTWRWAQDVGWGSNISNLGRVLSISLLLIIPLLIIINEKFHSRLSLSLERRKANRFFDYLGKLIDTQKKLHGRTHLLLLMVLITLAAQIVGAEAVWLLAQTLNIPIGWWPLLLFLSLVGIALILPISFNGIGIREVGLVGLLTSIHIDGSQALALSLATSLIVVSTSIVGGLSLLIDFLKRQLRKH